jgi:hypothetical protein
VTSYICTAHKTCGSTFDAYADWCHHEATEYPNPLDVWFCEADIPINGAYFCYTGFYTEEEFETHCAREHNDPDVHSDDYFLGPTLGAYYYCGFCQATWPTDGMEWWRARSKHLAVHFVAENTMADWVDHRMR